MKPTLVLLAAGMGSRYGGLKQIDPVGPSGEVIMDYSIFDAKRAGFGKIVFVIRKSLENEFREKIGMKYKDVLPVEYAFQELDMLPEGFTVPEGRTKPWGTAHAVLSARTAVSEPFAVINADDFYGQSAFVMLADYLSKAKDGRYFDYCMIGYKLRNTLSEFGSVARGVCNCSSEGYLIDIVERVNIARDSQGIVYYDEENKPHLLTGDESVSLNTWGFTPSIFTNLERLFKAFIGKNKENIKAEFYIPFAVDTLIKEQSARVKVITSEESWFGITYREDKPNVTGSIRKLVEKGVYPRKLF